MRRFLSRIPDSRGDMVINPASLPGWELSLRSYQGITVTDGASLTIWADQSGHGRDTHASLGTLPTYHSTGVKLSPSGKPCVTFNGLLDGLDGVWPATILAATGFTAYVVARTRLPINGFNAQSFWSSNGAHPNLIQDLLFAGQDFILLQDTVFGNRNYGLTQFGYHDYIWTCIPPSGAGGGANLAYIDGVTNGPSIIDWDWAVPGPNYQLGYNGSANCNMDLFSIDIFSRGHSAATVQGVRGYLRGVFGN